MLALETLKWGRLEEGKWLFTEEDIKVFLAGGRRKRAYRMKP